MKKVLFGIMALSVAAFAVNPGTGTPETASVPVEVRAEIVKAPTGLTITDEAGTVLDKLLIDHGRIVINTASDDSVIPKKFKVRRFDSDNGAVDILNGTDSGAKLVVSLSKATTNLNLNGAPDAASKLNSTLTLTGGTNSIDSTHYEHIVVAGEDEHIGTVTSTIPRANLYESSNKGLAKGIHHNSRDTELKVVYTPN